MWQLARVLRAEAMPDAVGKLVWADASKQEPCGVHGCLVPSIGVNLLWQTPFPTLLGPVGGVLHLDCIELLAVFTEEVPLWDGEAWRQMSNEAIRAAGAARAEG